MARQGFERTDRGAVAPEQQEESAGPRRLQPGRPTWPATRTPKSVRYLAGVGLMGLLGAMVPAMPASAATGDISTVAGSGECTPGLLDLVDGACDEFAGNGDTAVATSAKLNRPQSPVFFSKLGANYMYFADRDNHRVRLVSPGSDGLIDGANDTISTVAGNPDCGYAAPVTGTCDFWSGGYSGDGGAATSAKLNEPHAVTVDSNGNLYIADTKNHRVRKVTPGSDGLVTGKNDGETITTVAGTGTAGFSGDGGAATAAQLNLPYGLAASTSDLYIADLANRRVRKVASGTISTVAGNGLRGYSDGTSGSATVGQSRTVTDGATTEGSNTVKSTAASFAPSDIGGSIFGSSLPPAGATIVSVKSADTVVISTNATATASNVSLTITRGILAVPIGVTLDALGALLITDQGNHNVRKVTSGTISAVAGSATGIGGFAGDSGAATAALLNSPFATAVDASGNLYISDENNHRVRKVSTSGTITTAAGTVTAGFSGDGGPATSAQLDNPRGVAVNSGDLYIADTDNHRIRRVDF